MYRVHPDLDVLVGFELADVLLQEEQIEREVVPLAAGRGQDTHRGQQLVSFQEVGVPVTQEGAETGIDHHRDQRREDD